MKKLITISDSIGVTGDKLLKAALSQFCLSQYEVEVHPFVDEESDVDEILDDIKNEDVFVIYTLVVDSVKQRVIDKCEEYGFKYCDVMTPVLDSVSDFLNEKPKKMPGVTRKLDQMYFNRVDAIEFAVKYDDGKDPRGVYKADIILLGISRTSKTPLSMYLAGLSYKVCNIPLVPEVEIPEEIFEVDRRKIFGLTNNPEKLLEVRRKRLESMGLTSSNCYSDIERIMEEIKYAQMIYNRLKCPVINVANTSIEENASSILKMLKK